MRQNIVIIPDENSFLVHILRNVSVHLASKDIHQQTICTAKWPFHHNLVQILLAGVFLDLMDHNFGISSAIICREYLPSAYSLMNHSVLY